MPIIEARDRNHLYMSLSRRVRCMHCRRLCEHEHAAVEAASRLDNLSMVSRDQQRGVEDNSEDGDEEEDEILS